MAARACQWSGVATTTASTSRRSSTFRKSDSRAAPGPASFAAWSRFRGSTSQTAATSATPERLLTYSARWLVPRPPVPMKPSRTLPFAPSAPIAGAAMGREAASAPPPAVARNLLRERSRFMMAPLGAAGYSKARTYPARERESTRWKPFSPMST